MGPNWPNQDGPKWIGQSRSQPDVLVHRKASTAFAAHLPKVCSYCRRRRGCRCHVSSVKTRGLGFQIPAAPLVHRRAIYQDSQSPRELPPFPEPSHPTKTVFASLAVSFHTSSQRILDDSRCSEEDFPCTELFRASNHDLWSTRPALWTASRGQSERMALHTHRPVTYKNNRERRSVDLRQWPLTKYKHGEGSGSAQWRKLISDVTWRKACPRRVQVAPRGFLDALATSEVVCHSLFHSLLFSNCINSGLGEGSLELLEIMVATPQPNLETTSDETRTPGWRDGQPT